MSPERKELKSTISGLGLTMKEWLTKSTSCLTTGRPYVKRG